MKKYISTKQWVHKDRKKKRRQISSAIRFKKEREEREEEIAKAPVFMSLFNGAYKAMGRIKKKPHSLRLAGTVTNSSRR